MKIALLNGSAHAAGCTHTALMEVARGLEEGGAEWEEVQLGEEAVRGCIGCGACHRGGAEGCVFGGAAYERALDAAKRCDGLVVGSPVYYAGPNGALCALLDRLFYSGGAWLKGKPAAAVVNARRGGASAAFERLNKYFTINQMPVASSVYWNSTHGTTPEETRQDAEGMQTMRQLGRNLARLAKALGAGGGAAEGEAKVKTNFIR